MYVQRTQMALRLTVPSYIRESTMSSPMIRFNLPLAQHHLSAPGREVLGVFRSSSKPKLFLAEICKEMEALHGQKFTGCNFRRVHAGLNSVFRNATGGLVHDVLDKEQSRRPDLQIDVLYSLEPTCEMILIEYEKELLRYI